MAYREVRVFEVREVLRLWLRGEGIRATERLAGVDRKTVRRYVDAAVGLGVDREAGDGQLSDVLIAQVVEAVRPHRSDGHGEGWRLLEAEHDRIEAWLKTDGLTVRKVGELLARRGVVVPERTLHRYALEVCDVGRGRRGTTVRVADGAPGDELQVDFGKLGRLLDPEAGRQRDVWALIFTPVVSRYSFVWLSHRQSVGDVIAGFEAAWRFYGGVFATVIPDNLKAIVDRAHPLAPRLNQAFVEYAQDRGFVVDPARVRSPQDKPREAMVPSRWRATARAGNQPTEPPTKPRPIHSAPARRIGATSWRAAATRRRLGGAMGVVGSVGCFDDPDGSSVGRHVPRTAAADWRADVAGRGWAAERPIDSKILGGRGTAGRRDLRGPSDGLGRRGGVPGRRASVAARRTADWPSVCSGAHGAAGGDAPAADLSGGAHPTRLAGGLGGGCPGELRGDD